MTWSASNFQKTSRQIREHFNLNTRRAARQVFVTSAEKKPLSQKSIDTINQTPICKTWLCQTPFITSKTVSPTENNRQDNAYKPGNSFPCDLLVTSERFSATEQPQSSKIIGLSKMEPCVCRDSRFVVVFHLRAVTLIAE